MVSYFICVRYGFNYLFLMIVSHPTGVQWLRVLITNRLSLSVTGVG